MRRTSALSVLFVLMAHAALGACDDPAKPVSTQAAADAARAPSASPPLDPPPPEGCTRSGSLEGIEVEASCVLSRAADDVMRDLAKRVRIELTADATAVAAGSSTLLRLTISNVTPAEVLLVFDALPRAPGPRPDWSRLAGVPEARAQSESTPRLHWNVVTTDAWDHNVDGMPTVPGSATAPPAPRLLGVRLRPGAKLTHAFAWFAVRIPPPPPIVKDDAGHRFVPKTAAVPLAVGEYTASLEIPLHGVAPVDRTLGVKLRVEAGAPEPKKHKP